MCASDSEGLPTKGEQGDHGQSYQVIATQLMGQILRVQPDDEPENAGQPTQTAQRPQYEPLHQRKKGGKTLWI